MTGHMLSLNLTFIHHYLLLDLEVIYKVVFPYCVYNFVDTNRRLKIEQALAEKEIYGKNKYEEQK